MPPSLKPARGCPARKFIESFTLDCEFDSTGNRSACIACRVKIHTIQCARGLAFILAAVPAILGGAGCHPGEAALDGGAGPDLSAGKAAGEAADALAGGERHAGPSIVAWNMESFPLTENTPGIIESVLGGMRPDVVAVEEIEDEEAFLAMVDSLPGYAAVLADESDGYTRVGVLYREETVDVSEAETLFEDDEHTFPRPPLKVHVSMKGTDLDFDFVAVHLKARMDAASTARRRAACHELQGWIDRRVAGGADPDIVVAGDWNDMLTKAPRHNVFQGFLDAPERYRFLTQAVADAGDYSHIPFGSLIDHVLVTTSLLDAYGDGATEAVHLESSVTGYVKRVSDHRPIHVQFGHP